MGDPAFDGIGAALGWYDDEDEEAVECPDCGSTETVELHDERQTVAVCAGCGSDQ